MLNLFLLAGQSNGLTTDPNFGVIACNNAGNNLPELTLSIDKQYFDTNLNWLTSQAGFKCSIHELSLESKDVVAPAICSLQLFSKPILVYINR